VSRGNTITPRNKSSKLGLASNPSDTMVRNVVKPKNITNEAKPKIKKPTTRTTIPDGYIENPLTGEIIKKPKGMNAGFLKIGVPDFKPKPKQLFA
jgi:hypothetical protein